MKRKKLDFYVVPNSCRAPMLKFHFEILLFNLICTRGQLSSLIFLKLKNRLETILHILEAQQKFKLYLTFLFSNCSSK